MVILSARKGVPPIFPLMRESTALCLSYLVGLKINGTDEVCEIDKFVLPGVCPPFCAIFLPSMQFRQEKFSSIWPSQHYTMHLETFQTREWKHVERLPGTDLPYFKCVSHILFTPYTPRALHSSLINAELAGARFKAKHYQLELEWSPSFLLYYSPPRILKYDMSRYSKWHDNVFNHIFSLHSHKMDTSHTFSCCWLGESSG